MSPIPVDHIRTGRTSETDVRVVGFLEKDRRNAYDTAEIAKGLGLNVQSLRPAMARLTQLKRINRERVGRKFYYYAKPK